MGRRRRGGSLKKEVGMIMRRFHILLVLVLFLGSACTRYERQPVSFKMPAAYANATEIAGATVASKAYGDRSEAKEAFGFDIRGSGLFPVQVIFDNFGGSTLEIDPSQTFLIDDKDNIWPVMDSSLAYDRVAEKTELARIGDKGAKTGFLSGAAGALIGAAVGIVSGENVLTSAGKGAAVGAAAGATLGGADAATSGSEARAVISDDLRQKSLQNRAIEPQTIAHGFIFFPGEAEGAKELRLRLRTLETGEMFTVRMAL